MLKKILSNTGRAFVVQNDIVSNCTFSRLMLHACTLIRTISLSCCGISLSFSVLFHLVTHYFTFPVLFQLNSYFPQTFLNGQFTISMSNSTGNHAIRD